MGVTADSVVVELEAKFDRAKAATNSYVNTFEGGMSRIEASGAKAEGSIVDASAGMSKGLGAVPIAAGVAVVALGLLVGAANEAKQAMDFADEISDTAHNLHISTDALQEYRFALQKSGGDAKDFAGGLNNLSEKLGAAKSGAKEALRPFQQLGFTPEQIASLRTGEQALTAISDRIVGLGSSAEQDSVIKELGVEKLAPLILQGTAEMARLRDEAQRIGVVMDEGLVKKGAEAKDQFDAMHKVIDVQMKSALVDLAPIIISLTGLIAKMAVAAGDVVDKFRSIENRRRSAIEGQIEDARAQNARLQRGGLEPSERTVYSNNQALIDRLQAELARRDQSDPDNQNIALQRLGISTGTSLAKPPGKTPRSGKPEPPDIGVFLPSAVPRADPEGEKLREKLQQRFEDLLSKAVDDFTATGLVTPDKAEDAWEKVAAKFEESARKAEEEYHDAIKDGLVTGLEAAAEGDGIEYLAALLRRRLFEAVAEAITNGLQSAQGGGGVGGALATIGSFLFGRAAGGNVVAGQPYYFHKDEVMVPAQSGRVVTPSQMAASPGGLGGGGVYAPTFDLRGAVMTEDIMRQIQAAEARATIGGAQGGAQLAQARMARNARQVLR